MSNLCKRAVTPKGQKQRRKVKEPSEPLIRADIAKGTDKQYREWVQRQPSCISGTFSEYVNGEGRCIAAHVRRAGESGTAHKAPFACIPLTDAEHRLQHQKGELACLDETTCDEWTQETAKRWFDGQKWRYLQLWLHED